MCFRVLPSITACYANGNSWLDKRLRTHSAIAPDMHQQNVKKLEELAYDLYKNFILLIQIVLPIAKIARSSIRLNDASDTCH